MADSLAVPSLLPVECVGDSLPPVLPAFVDFSLAHNPYRCTADTVLPAKAADHDRDSVAIVYLPAPPFPIGITRVVATAKDSCGNSSETSFTVTVTTEICGARFYDANGNGFADDRLPIAGSIVTLTGSGPSGPITPTSVPSGADGTFCFGNLLPGSYAVSYDSTTALGMGLRSIAFPKLGTEGGCPAKADFGEFCIGKGGGVPTAYWLGPSGQKIMNDGGTRIPEMEELSALCLRNEDGTEFNPTTPARHRAWLLATGRENMAYALSVELATMYMSVEAGLVSGAAVVHAPGCGNRGPRNDCILVNDLIAIANAELCAHGSTPVGSPYRERQECLKRAIERVNGDANFLQKQPCAVTTIATPAKR